MHWVKAWLDEAMEKQVQRNPNTMTAVTVGEDGQPTGRQVLCKEFVPDPGYVVFYTNYESDKVRHLEHNENIGLVFHWDDFGRQARLEGIAVRSPPEESDAYFASRDWGSQIGAWGSDQSSPLESRAALIAQVGKRAMKLGVKAAGNLKSIAAKDRPVIPRPPHWGGIRVWPRRIELWIEGTDRIHDRARWDRTLERGDNDTFVVGTWTGTRLQP
ncbi:MAG: pyridoxamine 5'-phosphate oxidase [Woeseiaceae bacterium]|nr:pyridoxamine 5'-phosphate oxidase [Woeseiaceae bacterium]NIP20456.1 pyridoxamine 5'-phosphate oxidase [Woeseiaceae bacterium]NIS89051.1 pyridoxamine 5'-phosphate oxidase [Woeseiaceae bacterium]